MCSMLPGMWPCSLAGRFQHFGLLGHFHLHGRFGGWRFLPNVGSLLLLYTASHAVRLMHYLNICMARLMSTMSVRIPGVRSHLIKGPLECEAAERDVWFSIASIRFLRTCISHVMRIHRVHSDVEFDVTFSLPELLFAITRKG